MFGGQIFVRLVTIFRGAKLGNDTFVRTQEEEISLAVH